MSGQILILEKNKLDISDPVVTLTASEAQEFADFVRNRLNSSGWATTGSLDANNTTFEVDFANAVDLDFISLVGHNFKVYQIKYWNGASYVNFSTAINETTNAATTTFHEFTKVTTTKIKLTIYGTFTADEDKFLAQFIATQKIGRLNGWPTIKDPKLSRDRISTKMLSGKVSIKEQIGNFSCKLDIKVYSDNGDLTVFEKMYMSHEGFLVLLSGGVETQFSSVRIGYRNQDFYLMKCSDELTPEWYKGFYTSGQVVNIDLKEVID